MSGEAPWPLALTLAAYAAAHLLWVRAGRPAALNPTLVAIALVATALILSGADRAAYRAGAEPMHLLLGSAVVALAVPLYRHADLLRARMAALLTALATGSIATILVTVALAAWLGASLATLHSLAPKSATAGVSMAISAASGGVAALTAVVTILAGIIGAVAGPALLGALGIRDPVARGFGIGLASHGIGTARAFQESEAAGTAAGLAMGLNAVLTALIVPVVLAITAGAVQ
jgi:putative effector of murein hydrolase